MKSVLSQLAYELTDNRSAMLVTVAASSGSAPRGPGACMLVTYLKGRLCGTVGGGAVERAGELRALELLKNRESAVETFPLHPNDTKDIGMVCGGEVTLLFQYISRDSAQWKSVAEQAANRPGDYLFSDEKGKWACLWKKGEPLPEKLPAVVIDSLNKGETFALKEGCLMEQLPPEERAVIFGAGHIARALCPVLLPLGFTPVVYDDRPELALPESFPGARVLCGPFAELSRQLTLSGEDFIIVMTSGHANDLTVQRQVMAGKYAYLGVIGSRKKTAALNKKLLEEGVLPEALSAVHTPIGLPIGAVTPEEIAISIAAELIKIRAQRKNG